MNTRRSRIYLAHSCLPDPIFQAEESAPSEYAADLQPEDAAEYIAALLASLRAIAVQARFRLLSDLLSVAEEEAKLHFRA